MNVIRRSNGWDHKRRQIKERVLGIHLMISIRRRRRIGWPCPGCQPGIRP